MGLDYSGASVTMPHKEHWCASSAKRGGRDPLSDWCGAANTLVVESSGALQGCNTDAPAAVDCLLEAMECERDELSGTRIAVLGAGGSHVRSPRDSLIPARTWWWSIERALGPTHWSKSCRAAPDHAGTLAVGDPSGLVGEHFDAYLHAPSLGSPAGEHPEDSPRPEGVELDDTTTVLDSVYAPTPTPLLLQALQGGARVASGGSMFLRQAERQFTLWTGRDVPEGVMTAALTARG